MSEVEKKAAGRIAIFGGTFDPVHQGHLEVAKQAVNVASLDRVIFLPCRQSPHKEVATGASELERLEMLQRATTEFSWAEVSSWEYHQPLPSYSWRAAEYFRGEFPEAELFWLMGQDQWEVIETWSRAEWLSELVTFIVHARQGEQPCANARDLTGEAVFAISGDHPASSSAIRALFAEGSEVPTNWLPYGVEEIVQKRELYQK